MAQKRHQAPIHLITPSGSTASSPWEGDVHSGCVVWFSAKAAGEGRTRHGPGHGFIRPDANLGDPDAEDLFFHCSKILRVAVQEVGGLLVEKRPFLKSGDVVTYRVGEHQGRAVAIDVKFLRKGPPPPDLISKRRRDEDRSIALMEGESGTVVWYNVYKKMGFIRPADAPPDDASRDVFCHVTSLAHPDVIPDVGDEVTYDIRVHEGKSKAISVKVVRKATPLTRDAARNRGIVYVPTETIEPRSPPSPNAASSSFADLSNSS